MAVGALTVVVATAGVLRLTTAANKHDSTDVAGTNLTAPGTSESAQSSPDADGDNPSGGDASARQPTASQPATAGSTSQAPASGLVDATSPAPESGSTSGGKGNGNGNGGNSDSKTFTIAGSAQGLYPGGQSPLTLQLQNPESFDIRVTQLTVAAANSNKAGCLRSHLILPSYVDRSGSGDDVVVARRSSTDHTLQLILIATAPDACKNAVWSLTYSGRAVKA